MRFRTGRTVGRTIYVQQGDRPESGRDVCIGMLDSRSLAELAVRALNDYIEHNPQETEDLIWQYATEAPS